MPLGPRPLTVASRFPDARFGLILSVSVHLPVNNSVKPALIRALVSTVAPWATGLPPAQVLASISPARDPLPPKGGGYCDGMNPYYSYSSLLSFSALIFCLRLCYRLDRHKTPHLLSLPTSSFFSFDLLIYRNHSSVRSTIVSSHRICELKAIRWGLTHIHR